MKTFATQVKWQMLLLARNNIISISLLVTVIYALIFFGIRSLGNAEKLLTLFVLNDPAIIGLFFMGIALFIERRQQVLAALFVTPINHHIYLLARVVALSLIALLCGLGMAIAAVGLDFNWFHFSLGVFGLSVMCCLAGLILAAYTPDFLNMLLATIPVLLIFVNLPLLNYFEVTDIDLFKIMPAQGPIWLLAQAHEADGDSSQLLLGYSSMILWTGLIYWLAYRTFMKKIVNT